MPKKIRHYGHQNPFSFEPDFHATFQDIDERLNELEDRVLKTARKTDTTLKQQVLLMHHLGLLDKLNELNLSGVKKAKLLSVLLNGSYDNIYDHLSQVHKKQSRLKTNVNYEFLVNTFKEAGLHEHERKADKVLTQILNELEK